MADHGRRLQGAQEGADEAGPDVGEGGRVPRLRVLLPEEPPLLDPVAAAIVLRILNRASERGVQPTAEEERRAA